MTRSKLLLLLVASFSVMFVGLVALAAYASTQDAPALSLLCALFAFMCALGQFASLAWFLRERASERLLRQNRTGQPSNTETTS